MTRFKREAVVKFIGLVVQLVRIPACHAGGREFESRPDRQLHNKIVQNPVNIAFMGFFYGQT